MDLTRPLGTIVVLDIETRADAEGHRIANRTTGAITKSLNVIRNLSILTAREELDGRWHGFALRTLRHEDEFDLLMELDRAMSDLDRPDILVSYNGAAHDLPAIRRRAAAHWMFALPGLNTLSDLPHLDLFQRAGGLRGEKLSLRDLLGAYRVPANHLDHLRDDHDNADPGERKSEVDVVATFIALLFELAIVRRGEHVLLKGWTALRDHLEATYAGVPHLRQFALARELRARTDHF